MSKKSIDSIAEAGEITTFDSKGNEITLILRHSMPLYKQLAKYWGTKSALQVPEEKRKEYGALGGRKK
jgi:hypothetical protein